MMPRETITIELDDHFAFEGGVQLLAAMVHPLDPVARERCWQAGVYLSLRQVAEQQPAQRAFIRLAYLLQDASAAERIWGRGRRVLVEERIVAGEMARAAILSATTVTQAAGGAAGILADLRGRGESGGNADNVMHRSWTPSRPVLHVCAAFNATAADHLTGPLSEDGIGRFLEEADVTRDVINRANVLRLPVGQLFKIPEAEQIEIVLAGQRVAPLSKIS